MAPEKMSKEKKKRRDETMKNFNFDQGILEKVLSECSDPYEISITWAIECILETALNNPDFLAHVATEYGWGIVNDTY